MSALIEAAQLKLAEKLADYKIDQISKILSRKARMERDIKLLDEEIKVIEGMTILPSYCEEGLTQPHAEGCKTAPRF